MVPVTARQKVLAYIRRWNAVTAAQIARGLNMSAATVRHHLTILVSDGRVTTGSAAAPQRGRPQKLYRLSDTLAGDNLAMLSEVALDAWLGQGSQPNRQAAVEALAEALSDRVGRIDSSLPAPKRMVQLIDRLNGLHYQARWEAGAEGPRILFGHCPYAAVIDRHPELCAMDELYLGSALNAEVEQLSKIDRKSLQATQCMFAVRQPLKRRD